MSDVRWVAVDDTDGAINYSSGWAQGDGQNWNNQGNFGRTFMNSLHSVTGGSASFSYTFIGSNGKVIGTTNVQTSGGVQDPVWSCEVDGTAISIGNPFAYVENSWVLCQWDNISPGQHTLKVTATSSKQAFLFDQFQYVPSPSADIQNANIVVSCTDAAINYDSNWKQLGGDLARMAPAGGAVMSFPFYGTGITWFGYIPVELPHGSTTAEYSIDGGAPTTFTVPGSPGGTSQYNQLIFQIGSLSLGSHTLRVTSEGETNLTPLVLTNLVVQNGVTQQPPSSSSDSRPVSSNSLTTSLKIMTVVTTLPGGGISTTTISSLQSATPSSVNPSKSSNSSSSSSPTSLVGTTSSGSGNSGTSVMGSSGSRPPVGGIVGGVLGGLFVIVLLLFLYYRRRKEARNADELAEQVQPFYRDIPPSGAVPSGFSGPLSETSGTYSPHQTTQVGNSGGFFARKAAIAATSTRTPYTTTIHGLSPDPIGSPSSPFANAESSVTDSVYLGATNPSSETSAPSSTGSVVPLLRPNRKQEEYLVESSQSASSRRIVTHEDSGFRMPRAQGRMPRPPTEIVEYPPVYTPG